MTLLGGAFECFSPIPSKLHTDKIDAGPKLDKNATFIYNTLYLQQLHSQLFGNPTQHSAQNYREFFLKLKIQNAAKTFILSSQAILSDTI